MEISKIPKDIKEKKKLWTEKTSEEKCLIALKVQDKGDIWYVDSGCSKNMTGDKNKFLKRNIRKKLHLVTML